MSDDPKIDWSDVDWPPLVKRLLKHTIYKLRSMNWHNNQAARPLPKGMAIEDFVYEAIEKTIAKQRRWHPQKTTLFIHLCGVIDSTINHLYTGCDYNLVISLEDLRVHSNDDNDSSTSILDSPRYYTYGPCGPVHQQESDMEFSQVRDCILNNLKHDPLLQSLARIMIDEEIYDSKTLAARLKVNREDVSPLKERLKDRLNRLRSNPRGILNHLRRKGGPVAR